MTLTRLKLPMFGILKDKKVIVQTDSSDEKLTEWAEQNASDARRVAINHIHIRGYKLTVSTVFLGINHSLNPEHPLWFETMVFLNKPEVEFDSEEFSWADQYTQRYETYDEALEGHKDLVQRIIDKRYPSLEGPNANDN